MVHSEAMCTQPYNRALARDSIGTYGCASRSDLPRGRLLQRKVDESALATELLNVNPTNYVADFAMANNVVKSEIVTVPYCDTRLNRRGQLLKVLFSSEDDAPESHLDM
jgi:hypothetical protein